MPKSRDLLGICKHCGASGALYKGSRCLQCLRAYRTEIAKQWRYANPDKANAICAKYRAAHPKPKKPRVLKPPLTKEERSAQWRAKWLKNPEAARARCRKWSRNNPRKEFLHGLMSKYELSEAEFDNMLISQSGRCSICSCELTAGKLKMCVDHDHETGEVRGLLCGHCNSGLGQFKDSPEFLEEAARYLCEHRPVLRLVR